MIDGCVEIFRQFHSITTKQQTVKYQKQSYLQILPLNTSKCADPDELSPKLSKGCAHLLTKPLATRFSMSLEHSCVLSVLKNSGIVPIFKSVKMSIASKGRLTRTFTVSSGVSAGSILGPCLFIVFIIHIVDFVNTCFAFCRWLEIVTESCHTVGRI